jgi:hypothetical protein
MPGDFIPWGTTEWEDHIQKVLKLRYKQGGYQEIPAETHGDCGLEGVASDGNVYQCYSAQDYVTPAELLKKQKGKITADIGKLLNNEQELLEILGSVKIRRWYLVVPHWKNKDLIKHAKEKEAFVRKSGAKHIHPDFETFIITGDDFLIEKQELASVNSYGFDALPPAVDDSSLNAWLDNASNLTLIANLDHKAPLIVGDRQAQLPKFRSRIVKNFIHGKSVLNRLQKELPETFKRVADLKQQKEDDLETETALAQSVPAEIFEDTLKSFKGQLAKTPGLSERATTVIANEAVADWVMRCPLEF